MIVALVKDLFFISKIKENALQLNKDIFFIRNNDELIDFFDKYNNTIKEKNNNQKNTFNNENNNINLIIIDLNFDEIGPLETVQKLKNNEILKNKKIIAYCSHVQTKLMDKAKEFGIEVMPRSLFTKKINGSFELNPHYRITSINIYHLSSYIFRHVRAQE